MYFSDILATGKIPLSRSNTINESQGKEEEERCNEDGESPKEDQNKSGTPEPFEDPEDLEVKPQYSEFNILLYSSSYSIF